MAAIDPTTLSYVGPLAGILALVFSGFLAMGILRHSAGHPRMQEIQKAVLEVFDLRPAAILRDLDLLRPIYAKTSAYGHFGRELPEFTWERTDRADALKAAAGI